jgi:tricorn protease
MAGGAERLRRAEGGRYDTTMRANLLIFRLRFGAAAFGVFMATAMAAEPSGPRGYYRFPAIHDDTIVFCAEGDLWRVSARGGEATRLTSHPGEESHPAISPDGETVAFSAQYEGTNEVYTMPLGGGLPVRRTYGADGATVAGWTPDGKPLYETTRYSTLPDWQLATVNLATGESAPLPLSQASDGVFDRAGKTLFFTRQQFQGSSTKRYQGGTAQGLWRYTLGEAEAVPLTADFPGTSKNPMCWEGRIYFASDRDGTMNLWSMDLNGKYLRQHTRHRGWDVKGPSLSRGRIAYQLGADLRLYTIASQTDAAIEITLASDFDHERERWVKRPLDYLTAAHLSPNGDRLALTARGQVFVAPAGSGRFVEATRQPGIRHRQARFMPDGLSLVDVSDSSGELEFERIPANGLGAIEQISKGNSVFLFDGLPSPDGKWIAYQDKDQRLWLHNVAEKRKVLAAESKTGEFSGLAWSPDSQWLAYVADAENEMPRIWLYRPLDGSSTPLTSDRVASYSPAWAPDGKWIYFISDRHLKSVVASPWGLRQPEPFYDKPAGIYLVSLLKDARSPFEPADELHPAGKEQKKAGETNQTVTVTIDRAGLETRVMAAPVPAGNYTRLSASAKYLYWLSRESPGEARTKLMSLEIGDDEPKPKTFADDVEDYELSLDGKKILVRKGEAFHVDEASGGPAKLEKSVDLSGWTFPLNPREEWEQMLMRDYFYDTNMHGADWRGLLKKYSPLSRRVTDRAELSDLIGDMVGELSALHIFVRGGEFRQGPDQVRIGRLGASLVRDAAAGGYRVEHIYRSDPDYPESLSPLARPGSGVAEGDIIERVDGVGVLSVPQMDALLRNKAGRQTLLTVHSAGSKQAREVVVKPAEDDANLRYADWEYTRRLKVEEMGKGEIGYVHLRAMTGVDIAQWARDFYPVFNRQGLIIDVRHNRGGNIDSWILEKLLRKAWFYWQPRAGSPTWNMQFAFRGHLVALCDQRTASDGEAFTEGFRRLGLGKVIGTRTWGGEIWLSMDNTLVDKGIASAAEMGVYGPEGKWLIEGHGVDPDSVVDNPPHATFNGEDAQLKAAVEYLREEIRRNPVVVPPAPVHPDKSVKD